MMRCALVLGAGGHAASAWEIGLIAGLADAGIEVRAAELLVGTSAGARVAVQLASGVALEDLIRRQIDPDLQMPEAPHGSTGGNGGSNSNVRKKGAVGRQRSFAGSDRSP
jgi:predicted acylesterase/phospholipase RssA